MLIEEPQDLYVVLINISCIYKLKELFLSPAKELMKATNLTLLLLIVNGYSSTLVDQIYCLRIENGNMQLKMEVLSIISTILA